MFPVVNEMRYQKCRLVTEVGLTVVQLLRSLFLNIGDIGAPLHGQMQA